MKRELKMSREAAGMIMLQAGGGRTGSGHIIEVSKHARFFAACVSAAGVPLNGRIRIHAAHSRDGNLPAISPLLDQVVRELACR